AIVVSTGINFVCTGVAGTILFGEARSVLWCVGIVFILAGVMFIHRDSVLRRRK
uniref:Uncharacterized protein n=1 Tax=Acrobeloides nanus TaxID=290746 RepID=A0A914CAV2_9BILA